MAIQEPITTPISVGPTPEQLAYRALIAAFKTDIKNDATSIRAWKLELKELRGDEQASAQSRLHSKRIEARARLLIYGTLRGRTRDQMEPKHAEKSYNLRYYIARVWNAASTTIPMPETIKVIE